MDRLTYFLLVCVFVFGGFSIANAQDDEVFAIELDGETKASVSNSGVFTASGLTLSGQNTRDIRNCPAPSSHCTRMRNIDGVCLEGFALDRFGQSCFLPSSGPFGGTGTPCGTCAGSSECVSGSGVTTVDHKKNFFFDETTIYFGSSSLYPKGVVGSDGFPFLVFSVSTPSGPSLRAKHCSSTDCTSIDATLDWFGESYLHNQATVEIGNDGLPLIVAYQYSPGSSNRNNNVFTVHCLTSDCVSYETNLVWAASGELSGAPSIVMGDDGFPRVLVCEYDDIVSNSTLTLITCESTDCTQNSHTVITSLNGFSQCNGYVVGLHFDGRPYTIIQHNHPIYSGDQLMVSTCADSTCTSIDTHAIIDSVVVDTGDHHLSIHSYTLIDDSPVFAVIASTLNPTIVKCNNYLCTSVTTFTRESAPSTAIDLAMTKSPNTYGIAYARNTGVFKLEHCSDVWCSSWETDGTLSGGSDDEITIVSDYWGYATLVAKFYSDLPAFSLYQPEC